MKITANTKAVQLIDAEEFLSGAYNDITIDVELSEEYKGLTSFVTFNDEKTHVIAGKVSTPCLSEGLCRIGVYAVNIDDDNNVVLRYSPKPVDVLIITGSWNNRIAESNTPTASEAEKIYTLIDNAIAAGQLKGDKGDPYELTAQDKQDIVNQIPYASPSNHGMIKVPNGCGIVVDKEGSAKVTYPITGVKSTTDDIKIVKHTGGATDGQHDLTFNSEKYALKAELPTKTSDLENDSNFVSDENYIHTDNNYTDEEKTKLDSLVNYDDTELKEQIAGKQDKLTQAQLDNISAVQNKLDKSAVGNGLKFENGKLSLDIPVATASTTYGGDA